MADHMHDCPICDVAYPLLTGELRAPRTDTRTLPARQAGGRLEAIDRELRQIRHGLAGTTGWSACVQTERDRLLQRRGELEEERRRMERETGA